MSNNYVWDWRTGTGKYLHYPKYGEHACKVILDRDEHLGYIFTMYDGWMSMSFADMGHQVRGFRSRHAAAIHILKTHTIQPWNSQQEFEWIERNSNDRT